MMDTNSPPPTAEVERRSHRRAACTLDITLRQRGRFAVVAATDDLTTHGCRLSGAGPFAAEGEVWVRLPGIESQAARVAWSEGRSTGVVFAQPLHPAVYARFLPAAERLTVVSEPAAVPAMPQEVAQLSRREQIIKGFGSSEPGPLTLGKKPVGGGLGAAIRRGFARSADHRREERFADGLRTGPMRVSVGALPAQVRNVSASGIRVSGELTADVGALVPVAFEGFDPLPGRIVWRRGDEAGLSLPGDSIGLAEA